MPPLEQPKHSWVRSIFRASTVMTDPDEKYVPSEAKLSGVGA
jgi:hypothetical protein